ncbi:MAG: hypothetical protein GX848_07805 [Clostridiales bacterium]|nr:hypothetical protein [Clostridiales bacterium]
MKKISKEIIVTLLSGIVVLLGITGYFSYEDFLKPIKEQIIHGYSDNNLENPTVSKKLKSAVSSINKHIDDEVGYKTDYIELNTVFQMLMGQKVFEVGSHTVVRLNNKYLTYQYDDVNDITIEKNANAVIQLDDYLKEQNIPLLYCLAPYKNSNYDYQLPNELKDTINTAANKFIKILHDNNVDYIDFREEIHNEGFEHYSCFYVTDHHWKAETGFWAFTKMANHLKENYGFEFDDYITDLKNYNIKEYKRWFLGSQGKKVGKYVAGIDDINIITPKFETHFITEQPLKKRGASGAFDKTLLSKARIEEKDLYNLNPYAAYTGGDFSYQIITNSKAPNNKTLLVVRDSFACAVTPFLSLSAKKLYIFDFRDSLTKSKTDSLYNYIEKINPDAVLFIYSSSFIGDPEEYNFSK